MGVVPHAVHAGARHDRHMAPAPLTISIEIDRDPAALRGRVLDDGSVHEFEGWLGLLGALGIAIDRHPGVGGPPAPPG
jgi:hypothetical protein